LKFTLKTPLLCRRFTARKRENKEGKNSSFKSDFKDNKEESTLFNSLKRLAISGYFVTQS
jgi:hypothetical protein